MFRKPSLGLVLSVLVFIGAIFIVRWVVRTQRAPGAVTVIEAQAMDMNSMKAPEGTQVVSVVPAADRTISSSQSFPATAVAYSDEEIVARIPGRILWTSYPGDRVKAGQVVARIEAEEYAAQAAQAHDTVSERRAMTVVAQDEVNRLESAHRRSIADAGAMSASVETAQANLQAAIADQMEKVESASAKESAIADAKAQEEYLAKVEQRDEKLYSEGVVSLDRFQRSQAEAKSAASKVAFAQAEATAAHANVAAASARIQAARKAVEEEQARLLSAKSQEREAAGTVEKAKDEVKARKMDVRAEEGSAAGSQVMQSYRELRALNDAMVADRLVGPGSVVTAGQKVLMLHVADPIRMQANVPQGLAASLRVGSLADVTIGNVVRHARVTNVFPQADPASRTFTVEVLLPNHDHAILPGLFGSMSLQTADSVEGLAVPSSAILSDSNGAKFVWLAIIKPTAGAKVDWTCPMHSGVSEPGPGKCPICSMPLVQRSKSGTVAASRKGVETGVSDSTDTIVTKGLSAGDQVIVSGQANLVEGSPIKVFVTAPEPSQHGKAAVKSDRVRQHWTCPMHPQIDLDHPGKCPICGMDLVLKKARK